MERPAPIFCEPVATLGPYAAVDARRWLRL
jgi:hypothetical protein